METALSETLAQMNILSIDPHVSKPYAYSFIIDKVIRNVGKVDSVKFLAEFIMQADLVVIEDQYLCKSFRTSKELSWSAGKVAGVAELFGKSFEFVNVAIWKTYFGLLHGSVKQKPSEKVKAMENLAQKELPDSIICKIDEDIASAILIGIWATRTH